MISYIETFSTVQNLFSAIRIPINIKAVCPFIVYSVSEFQSVYRDLIF